MMRKAAVILLIVALLTSLAGAAGFGRPWYIPAPRATLLPAWQRLKNLEIPAVPTDSRFQITGRPAGVRTVDGSFYVSPTGDDAHPGTQSQPWRTLAKACAALQPNMVVYLMAGTYYGPAAARTQGTEQAPAAIRAMEGAEVIIRYSEEWIQAEADKLISVEPNPDESKRALGKDGQTKHYPALLTLSGSFIEVSGLHFIGARDRLPHNWYSENGVSVSGGTGYRILYNEIENVGHCGIKAMGHGEYSFLIEGNCIHNVGHTGHDHGIYGSVNDITIRRNLILNSSGWGVHAYTAPERMIVSHNIIAGHAEDAIVLGGPQARIHHNVIFGNRRGGLFFFRDKCRLAVVNNNIFWGPAQAFRVDTAGDQNKWPSANLVDYNCIAPEASAFFPSPAYTYGLHNITADPGFVDAAAFDFTIRPDSPCVDAGDPSVGAYYGKAPDIGLFEVGHP